MSIWTNFGGSLLLIRTLCILTLMIATAYCFGLGVRGIMVEDIFDASYYIGAGFLFLLLSLWAIVEYHVERMVEENA